MRANAFAGGHADRAVLERDLGRLGLGAGAQESLRERVGPGCR